MSEHEIEVTAGSLDAAVQEAATALGVSPEALVVEVLETTRKRFGRRQTRIRASRKTPEAATSPDVASNPKEEDAVADTNALVDEGSTDTTDEEELSPEERMAQLDEEADIAADFIEGLLDLLDLPGDIEIEVDEQQAFVTVQDVGSGLLIGRRGATLEALQELVRCTVQRSTERRSRVRVDVEGYRARQLEKLRGKCRDAIAEVRETGQPVKLEPMDAYERKMMHDLVAQSAGVTSASEGTEPRRRVVIHPDS